MEKLVEKVEKLAKEIVATIEALLETKGVGSRFTSSRLVLVIHDEKVMFNLGSRNYIVEISEDKLIDNNGYEHEFCSLELEDLCAVIDSIADGITPTFRVGKVKDDEDVFMYFEDKQTAYTEFVKIQCKNEQVSLEERKAELDRHGMPQYEVINEHLVD